jgi:Sulfotransferase family
MSTGDLRPTGGPVFVLGTMGSGTTLLRLMLDSHPNLAIPPETGFMRTYDAHRFQPFKHSGRGWAKRLGWTPAELDELLGQHFERLFMRYAAQHGKTRWGEKTPLHTWHVEDMARVFPDAQFVAMVRHPAATVSSNMNRFSNRLGRAATHWKRYTSEIVRQTELQPGRMVVLRYEELVTRPEAVMRELLAWLGEPWSDDVLAHHEVQGARGGRLDVEGRSRADDPVDVARVDRWTRQLEPDVRAWLGQRLTRQAQLLGYAIDEPMPVEPLADDGSLLASAAAVAARIDRFPELDLRTKGVVPVEDRLYSPRELVLLTRQDWETLTARRGVRGLGVRLVRRLPESRREAAVRIVRGARAAVGLRRRPRRGV